MLIFFSKHEKNHFFLFFSYWLKWIPFSPKIDKRTRAGKIEFFFYYSKRNNFRKYFQNNLFRTRKITCLRFLSMLYIKRCLNSKKAKKIKESSILIDWKISMLKKSIFLTFVYYYWLYFDKFYVNKKKILKPYDFEIY